MKRPWVEPWMTEFRWWSSDNEVHLAYALLLASHIDEEDPAEILCIVAQLMGELYCEGDHEVHP